MNAKKSKALYYTFLITLLAVYSVLKTQHITLKVEPVSALQIIILTEAKNVFV